MSNINKSSSQTWRDRMRAFTFPRSAVMLVITILVCLPAVVGQEQSASTIQQHAYFDPTSKWPKPSVYVCWENPDSRFTNDMNSVRAAVADSWEAASAIRFTGWQKCAQENAGIRILIDDSGPHTQGLGRYLDGVKNGMVLNFTYANCTRRKEQSGTSALNKAGRSSLEVFMSREEVSEAYWSVSKMKEEPKSWEP
jgi:hypothetical protein